jgi:hypothetical protein
VPYHSDERRSASIKQKSLIGRSWREADIRQVGDVG